MSEIADVGVFLKWLTEWLDKRGINLDDAGEKKSHEGKTLIQHVRECWGLSDQILRRVGLTDNRLRLFCFSLCVAHDIGKLDPEWQIGKRRPKQLGHSRKSWELLNIIWKEGELTRLLPIPSGYQEALIYAVLKHHSSLSPLHDIPYLQHKLRRFLSGNINLAVDVADTIGVFKLADILSALSCSLDFQRKLLTQYEWSKQFEVKIDSGIRRRVEDKELSFNFKKYELQKEIASSSSKHIVFAAPTGWGKTAVALLRIKHMKPRKVFYILPTITAIREFTKILEYIFGPEYVGEYFYFADVEYLAGQESLEEFEYPIDFYRYFVPKIMITTVDQLLLTTLQFGKYHLRRYNLRDSLLIFDEFHLFTPQMVGALKAVFEELADIYNFSVLLMSATPSETYVNALEETLKEYGEVEERVLKDQYEQLRRHSVERVDESLLEFLQEKENELKGKRILVISNTVDGAVQAYNFFRKVGYEAHLIHGRFTYKDRMKKEKELSRANILVSTQVAEVSLDISYDVLITELAPIPSLIQRFGRVNRYGKYSKETNIYICKYKSEGPYSPIELKGSEEVLDDLITDLQKDGEYAYLNILDDYYNQLFSYQKQWEIEPMYKNCKEMLSKNKYFYCFKLPKDKNIFGREPSCLAIPRNYRTEVRKLKEEMRGRTYEERRRLLANLKKYFISVPLSIIAKESEWDKDIGLFVVGIKEYVYDPERGLVKEELSYT